jgi:WD40 repeat protein
MTAAPPSPHPSEELLRRFDSGQLRGPEAEAVEAHLAGCAECCRTLQGLGGDTLAQLLLRVGPASGCSGAATLSPAAAPAAPEVPAALREHPRYDVLGPLGAGGMGSVFKALHKLMRRLVTLKVLGPQLTARPEFVERFHREMRAVAALDHPHIVRAFDADSAGEAQFLVMEYVEGTDLARVLAERGPLPVTDACTYARQAAQGLQHAHEHGLTHRDVKPSNLLLTAWGTVKLLDFGLALLVREDAGPASAVTAEGVVLGTADYMAPEQADDPGAADIRSDVYSLGCTLYHMLAGRPPFPSGTLVQKLKAHAAQEPPPLRELRPEVPEALAAVIARMMAKAPADRFATPAEVPLALAPFTAGQAAPPRRRRRLALAPALAAMAALAAVVVRLETDKGELVITTGDPDVEVVVRRNGRVVTVVDRKSGHKVRLRTGEYDLGLKGERPGLQLDVGKVTIRRGERELATVERVKPPAEPEVKPAVDHPPGLVLRRTGLGGEVAKPALSPDGRYYAFGTAGGEWGELRDLRTGEEMCRFRTNGLMAFTGDGRHLVARVSGTQAVVYRVPDCRRVRVLEGSFGLWDLYCSADGKRVLGVAAGNAFTRVWDLKSGTTESERPLRAYFSGDGTALVGFSGGGKEIQALDLESGRTLRRFSPRPDGEPVLALLAGQRELLVCNRTTRQAEIWDMATGKNSREFDLGPTWFPHHAIPAAASPDGKRLLTSHDDGFVRLWDLATGKETWRLPTRRLALGLTFSADGRYAAAGTHRGELYVWRVPPAGTPAPKVTAPAEPPATPRAERAHLWVQYIYHAAFSPDGRHYLATGERNPTLVRVWNTQTGEVVRVLPGWQHAEFTPDGKRVLACGADNAMRLWDLASGRELRRLAGHSGYVDRFELSADGKRVLSWSGRDGTLRLWDLETGKELGQQRVPGVTAAAVALSADGKRAASCDGGGNLRLWDLDGFREVRSWKLPDWNIRLRFLPGGKRLVTVSPRAARFYDVGSDGEAAPALPLDLPDSYPSFFFGLSADAGRLLVPAKDHLALRVLELPSGRELVRFRLPAELFTPSRLMGLASLSPDVKWLVVPVTEDNVGRVYLFRMPEPR